MGCSRSKTTALSNNSIEQEPGQQLTKTSSLVSEQSNRLIENCTVIWFLNDYPTGIEHEIVKLRHIVSTVKIFTDHDALITYIMSVRIEKIFLIVPVAEPLIESIQNLPQIEKIYILHSCSGVMDKNIDLITLPNVFYNVDSLCQQLETDVDLCELDLLAITTSTPLSRDHAKSSEKKKQEAAFLFFQLVREILFRLKFENNAKHEFIHFCRLYYANNPEQLHMIDDFEKNYRPQKALWWLMRRCFVWRVLQRMQRTLEVDILYKLGFLLKHVHTQLNIFQENSSLVTENILPVYRGKTMFADKFIAVVKNNCDGLLSFGSLFIAHTAKDISINFVRRRLAALPNAVGILFEIHINPAVYSTRSPFALLSQVHVDEYTEKNGVLFSMCTVFRIDSIEEFIDQSALTIWTVKLSLIPDDDEQLLSLVAPLRSSEVHANPLSFVGKLFMEMEEYVYAEQFFLEMLQDTSIRSQPRRLVRVHNGLGANYMLTGNYNKALEQYQQALDISLTYLPPKHTDLAPLYDAIGKSYYHLGDYKKAVEHYENASDVIGLSGLSSNDPLIIDLSTRIDNTKKLFSN